MSKTITILGLVLFASTISAQQSTVTLGSRGVSSVIRQSSLDATVNVPKTGAPLSTQGKWSALTKPPADCPATTAACVEILYTVPEADVTCQWTVVFSSGNNGHIVEENADSARYFTHKATPAEAKALVDKDYMTFPDYPSIMRTSNQNWPVTLVIVVGADGKLETMRALSGPPLLSQATQRSVETWRFKPFLVGTTVTGWTSALTFTFQGGANGYQIYQTFDAFK